jgi:sulfide:quinone oxidoreductase
MPRNRTPRQTRVVVAGGGIAAVEALLALRALAGEALELTLVAPEDELVYRPLAVSEPFTGPPARRYRLDAICRDLGVTLRKDSLAAVEHAARAIVTGSGERLGYDALVIAVGARENAWLAHARTFFADREPEGLHWLVRDVEQGILRRVAFVVPAGGGWSLPLYELALMTAARAREMGIDDAELTLVTPEDVPLAAFRGAGSAEVARLLDEARVTTRCATYVRGYDGRTLELVPGGQSLAADAVLTLPALAGPAIAGVPSDPDGFVHADEHGRVPDLDGVYAIGDATTFAIKQGGIAAQQADVVAALIARAAGIPQAEPRTRPLLRAILFTGGEPLYLTATITGGESVASRASRHCLWWPPHKIAARHLAPYLADREETDRGTARRHALGARLEGQPAVVHADPDAGGIELLGKDA